MYKLGCIIKFFAVQYKIVHCATGLWPPPPSKSSKGWFKSVEWVKYHLLPTRIGVRYCQTKSNLCQAALWTNSVVPVYCKSIITVSLWGQCIDACPEQHIFAQPLHIHHLLQDSELSRNLSKFVTHLAGVKATFNPTLKLLLTPVRGNELGPWYCRSWKSLLKKSRRLITIVHSYSVLCTLNLKGKRLKLFWGNGEPRPGNECYITLRHFQTMFFFFNHSLRNWLVCGSLCPFELQSCTVFTYKFEKLLRIHAKYRSVIICPQF